MINRVVDLIVKDIRKECESRKICTNKCPYSEFCEEYYSNEYIDTFDDYDVAVAVKKCIKADVKNIMKDILKEVLK